ncbi:Uncharacterised protein [Achromobacter insolitus]|uniref:hypothetical protein n=1 Tax=Achromobacter insolitus TaxID=217204 RepID=UPI000F70BD13|nr:hypothetical protein [Achromobacter insolitus]CAB3730357.1 hypothetical protein LMG6003_04708 [Achromobacter insolitus]VEG67963.1 Uncharacterised protein [Achromobacter insolitus]
MRRIVKNQTPECLQTFIDGQLAIDPEPVNVTYRCFPKKVELLAILTAEQFGLCGYTGVAVDERISALKNYSEQVTFGNHIEHLKSQTACRQELVDWGGEYGRDLCDDLSYVNMIAAVEVRGAEREHFGAVKKKALALSVLPTQEACGEYFKFRESDGGIEGMNDAAKQSITVLELNHDTLKGWRKAAIDAWLDPDVVQTREDFEKVAQAIEEPANGKLPEFAFVIGSIAKNYLP